MRWTWPISSTVVVLPFEPVSATNSCSSSRQPSSSSPITRSPAVSAVCTTGASRGTPGLLTTVAMPASRSAPSSPSRTSTPAASSRCLTSASTTRASVPTTRSPRDASASAAATPERARPTTRNGPGGSGGRAITAPIQAGRAHRPRVTAADVPVSNGQDARGPDQDPDAARRRARPGGERPVERRTGAWSRTCATSGRPATGARRLGRGAERRARDAAADHPARVNRSVIRGRRGSRPSRSGRAAESANANVTRARRPRPAACTAKRPRAFVVTQPSVIGTAPRISSRLVTHSRAPGTGRPSGRTSSPEIAGRPPHRTVTAGSPPRKAAWGNAISGGSSGAGSETGGATVGAGVADAVGAGVAVGRRRRGRNRLARDQHAAAPDRASARRPR